MSVPVRQFAGRRVQGGEAVALLPTTNAGEVSARVNHFAVGGQCSDGIVRTRVPRLDLAGPCVYGGQVWTISAADALEVTTCVDQAMREGDGVDLAIRRTTT